MSKGRTTVNLIDLVKRQAEPKPWAEGEKIPWDDPGFSQRMLQEHLTDRHDAASRRSAIIDRHVEWIHNEVLKKRPSRVLDLGCGPGLYTSRLARLGHTCVGIDFGPASIDYAREQAQGQRFECDYHLGDIRQVDYGDGFDLAMLIFGELNVFHPEDAVSILRKSRAALRPGGQLLLEVHTFDAVQRIGTAPATWRTSESGLFSPKPHLLLEESFWNEHQRAATTRYFVVDAETATGDRYAATAQAYTDEDYRSLISSAGFELPKAFPSLDGTEGSDDFLVYAATATGTEKAVDHL
jgi:SAM-dependent methyltransferase